jgi:transcriptional regulator of met regulon
MKRSELKAIIKECLIEESFMENNMKKYEFKTTPKHVKAIINEFGQEPEAWEVADYCYENYSNITNLDEDIRDDEMEFPDEIYDIVHALNINIDEFTEAFGQ